MAVGFRLVSLGLMIVVGALAHFTWVFTADPTLEVGKTVTVGIAHGHKFPQSEEASEASRLDFFAIAPSGARAKLPPSVAGMSLIAAYTVKEPGLHRIVLVQDRGVTSRTPAGVKAGGRDKHPDATQAYRTFRSAVGYARTAGSAMESTAPVGLEFELIGEYRKSAWQLQLLKAGKPVPDAVIQVLLPGAAEPGNVGRTSASGKLAYRPLAQSKGPALFSVELRQPPPAGEKYDFINYATSLYVNW